MLDLRSEIVKFELSLLSLKVRGFVNDGVISILRRDLSSPNIRQGDEICHRLKPLWSSFCSAEPTR
jgi:hypothetical protein